MKRFLSFFLACLCLAGMLPLQANAQNVQQQFSMEAILNAPTMEVDFSRYLQLPMFNGIATIDVGDNAYYEQEPNDEMYNANPIAHDYTVSGDLSESDLYDAYTTTLTSDCQITLVSSASTESLFWGLLDEDGYVLATSEDLGSFDGYYGDGLAGTISAGTYYFVALDENSSIVNYTFYFEVHPHTYTVLVTDPTCTEDGYTTYSCECGFYYTDDTVTATGHVYADDTDVNCDQCGYIRNTSSEEDSESQEFPFSEWEWEVLKLTNDERLEMGLSPLTGFAKLQEATDIRAAELTQSFSHIRPDGTDCFTVLDEVGIPYYGAGENIAQGHTAPAWVMNSWMNSTGHRANILTDGFSHLGVGEINFNWVQIFLGSTGYYTSINVVPEEATVAIGTTINDMGLVAVLNSSVYGECYLPVVGSYCIGYDPDVAGAQTVTISVLGVSSTFEIYVKDHDHSWTNASCTTPETCIICGEIQGAPLGHSWIDASCTTPKYCSVCGSIDGTAIGHNYVDSICTNCGRNENEIETIPMYRLYNPYTQEHLLSSNEIEKNQLVSVGWSLDGIAWNAPIPGEPVYRLYNPFDDWHIYTVSQAEVDMLTPLGWTVDGVVSRSATKSEGVPIYRLFNPYEQKNYHLLTASEAERDYLVSLGWRYEGIGWYAIEN